MKALRKQAKSKVILYPSTAPGSMALTEERFKELMEMMTQKQNREVEEKFVDKLDDVKKKITGSIRTVTDRQDKMENDQ